MDFKIVAKLRFLIIFQILITTHIFSALSKKEREYVKNFRLENGHLRTHLDTIFLNNKNPKEVLEKAGWKFLKNGSFTIVAEHRNYPEYVIKVVPYAKKTIINGFFNERNISRVIFLQEIKRYLKNKKELDFIILPEKWIYEILGADIHVIVATKLDIIEPALNFEKLKTFFTQHQQDLMYKFINDLSFIDGHSNNLCITKQGKLALVDTEGHVKLHIGFLNRILNGIFRMVGRKNFDKVIHAK